MLLAFADEVIARAGLVSCPWGLVFSSAARGQLASKASAIGF
jgi:hypothetical protein